MQKSSTLNFQNDLLSLHFSETFSPKESTVQTILQFAAGYRVEKLADGQVLEYMLN